MKFKCPNCSQHLEGDDELVGQLLKCPSCEQKIKVPQSSSERGAAGTKKKVVIKKGTAQKKSSQRRSTTSIQSRKRGQKDSTNVSMMGSGGIGLLFMFAFYILMLPMRNIYLGQLFYQRGWVPYVLVLLMGWSIGFLILKMKKLAGQKNSLLLDMCPTSIANEIDTETVEDFLEYIDSMPTKLNESFMFKRIKKGLEFFSVRHSNPEVTSMMLSQSDMDANSVHSSIPSSRCSYGPYRYWDSSAPS